MWTWQHTAHITAPDSETTHNSEYLSMQRGGGGIHWQPLLLSISIISVLDQIPKVFKVERLIHLLFHWPCGEMSMGGTSLYWSNFSLSSVTNSIHMATLNHQDDIMVNAKEFEYFFLFRHLYCVVEIGKAFVLVPFKTQDDAIFFIATVCNDTCNIQRGKIYWLDWNLFYTYFQKWIFPFHLKLFGYLLWS